MNCRVPVTPSATLLPVARPRNGVRDPDRETRLLHIEVGTRILGTDLPVRKIARQYGVSRATAYRWLELALSYDDAEAEALRMLRDALDRP